MKSHQCKTCRLTTSTHQHRSTVDCRSCMFRQPSSLNKPTNNLAYAKLYLLKSKIYNAYTAITFKNIKEYYLTTFILLFAHVLFDLPMNRGNIQGDGIYHRRFLQTGVDFSQVSLRDHKSPFELVVNLPPNFSAREGRRQRTGRAEKQRRSLLK